MQGGAPLRDVWFVGFPADGAVRQLPWWGHLLRPGYRHVLAAQGIGGVVSLVVNPLGRFLDVQLAPVAIGELLADWHERLRAEVLQVRRIDAPHRPALRAPLTCVEVVKALLGVSDPRILTPYALREALLRRGAVMIEPVETKQ